MTHHLVQYKESFLSFIKELRQDWKHTTKRTAKTHRHTLFYLFVIFLTILFFIPVMTYFFFAKDLKEKENIMNRGKTGLTLLDRRGKPFFTFYQPKQITYIPLNQIPPAMQHAVISAEDQNFYSNPGFSVKGIIRAFLVNILAGKIVEGGSTITQELVKNSLLSQSQTFLRKYQELVLAYELNRRYTKQDILEMYLNSAYFGEGAFGIENASEAYFGKHTKDLTLPEAALLAGLLPAPSALSPLSNNPNLALKQQHLVLSQMVKTLYITKNDADSAEQTPIIYHPIKQINLNSLAPHFAIYVKNDIIKNFGEERVIRDGFVVQTTLDSAFQQYAEQTVENDVTKLSYNKASNGSAVALDPKTGEIKVMVGSVNWNNSQFGKTNMAITPRQPGSSFKPIVYAYALEHQYITPATILQDTKTVFPGKYEPHDFDESYRGPVTVRRALANSLNIPSVQIMQQVGVGNALWEAKQLGIHTLGADESKYGLSLVLGTGEVPLLDMAGAYSIFANEGVYNHPISVLQIKDKYQTIVYTHKSTPQHVLNDSTAYLITSILSDNIARQEEFDGLLTISRPAAVKTGTTEKYRDALTIGYTPNLTIGVWVGNNDNSSMDNVAGALGAAPIWRSLMEEYLSNTPMTHFHQPESVISQFVCPYRFTSTIFSSQSAYQDYFIRGTQPSSCGLSQPEAQQPSNSPTPTQTPNPTQTPEPTQTGTPTPTLTPLPTITPTPTQTVTPIQIIPTISLTPH